MSKILTETKNEWEVIWGHGEVKAWFDKTTEKGKKGAFWHEGLFFTTNKQESEPFRNLRVSDLRVRTGGEVKYRKRL